jgi:hypothetical protein
VVNALGQFIFRSFIDTSAGSSTMKRWLGVNGLVSIKGMNSSRDSGLLHFDGVTTA